MAEYIEKKTAIDAVESVPAADWLTKRYTGELERIPPADVRPVVRGKWITTDDDDNRIAGRCSACGWEAHLYEDDVVGMNYCPNCGSGMGEE